MENYVGEIRLFAGNFAPQGWALCNGQLLGINQFDALYTLVGTTYGGDGLATFGVPDLRGRVPVGQGNGGGLSPRVLGQAGGEESHTLSTAEIPSHSHPANVSTTNATINTPGSTATYGTVVPNGDTYSLYTSLTQPTVKPHLMGNNAVGMTGGSQPHDNTMPTMPINYIIALYGVYPSRN